MALIDRLKGVNLYLIGMMGSGKTTVGQRLAKALGYQFFDTDQVITTIAGRSVAEIFADSGEPDFRQLETQVLAELSTYRRLVVATGGGIVLSRQNWSYLRHGIVIWLDTPIEQLEQRLQQDASRPLLQAGESSPTLPQRLQTLWNDRQALYAQADARIALTTETPEQVCARIIDELPSILKPEASDRSELN